MRVDLSVARANKSETSPIVYKQLFKETLQKYPIHKIIYTVGSRIADGVGCAVLLSDNKHLLKALLPHRSVFHFELIEIAMALEVCKVASNHRSLIALENMSSEDLLLDVIQAKV